MTLLHIVEAHKLPGLMEFRFSLWAFRAQGLSKQEGNPWKLYVKKGSLSLSQGSQHNSAVGQCYVCRRSQVESQHFNLKGILGGWGRTCALRLTANKVGSCELDGPLIQNKFNSSHYCPVHDFCSLSHALSKYIYYALNQRSPPIPRRKREKD